jgi:S-adenosylmethionine decarboxylase
LQSLGRHVLAEVYGCHFEVLNDIEKVQDIMVNAALEAGAEVGKWFFTNLVRRESAVLW